MTHPLEKFACCPACGSRRWTAHNAKSKHCEDCGFTYYANPSAATAALIVNDRQELLVVRRGKEPAKGTLDLPGGFCDMGETVEEGMRREIREETGLEVGEMRYLFSAPNVYRYSGMDIHTMDMVFLVRVPVGHITVHAADDAQDARWLPLDAVRAEDFGLTSIRNSVARFLRETLRKQKKEYIYKV